MKLKNLLFVFCLALLAGCQKDPDTESTPVRDTDKVEGVIRMKLDRETAEALNVIRTRSGRVLTGNISFDELCERYNVTGMERLFADNGCAERTRKAGLDLWYIIRFEGSAEQVAEDFGEIAGVNHVEIPRRITKVGGMSRKSGTPWRKLMALPKAAPSNYPFNDPLFGGQWPLYNDGTINANAQAGADINVLPAWEKTAGRSDVIVAVVDEGVEYTHPDLAGNMWSGIGKNFCDRDNDDITWGEGHGTHVAGTIAAVSNNGIGISGIAGGTGGGNGAKIMSCEIFHPTDGHYDANSNATADAIKYAADNGAVICQNSWGDGFGENGIFYVSYYDTNIGTHNVAYTRVDDVHNYDHIYQSDLCGWVGKLGYDSDQIYGANVFEAKGSETLSAASFYATGANTQYEVYVVHDFENEKSFAQREQLASGTLQKAGYYTVDFDTKVSLKKGERYAVLVYLKTPGTKHPMAIEYDTGEKILQGVDLDDGEGYISLNGKNFVNVKEKKDCNLCIKAFTRD